ncbi:MAG: hypothetical protein HKN14_09515 [Marinicaulis sp.]|nr:hypothetical protein [Marinicaulis sp.]
MTKPKKYEDIDFKPPASAAENAERGLDLRSQHNRGGTAIGVARARDLKNRVKLSPNTIERMVSYFARHAVDKDAENFGNDDDPSAGYIAWLLWGGDEGHEWAQSVKNSMDEADNS